MRKMFETNVFGLVDITNRVVPLMKAQAQGDIVNIASTPGMKGAATATSYGSSKWAVRGISQCWQAELETARHPGHVCARRCPINFEAGRPHQSQQATRRTSATIMARSTCPPCAWPELAVFANNPWKED